MPQSTHSSYHIKRIGEAATKPDVADVMVLKYQDTTSFGRRQETVDYYVDSSRLKNMISRLHAEIHCKYEGQLDDYVYYITDKSLNGTYVNDTRVVNSVQLKDGDVITFGHINGVSIKPGEYSKQKKSEFKFVFEKSDDDDDVGPGRKSAGKKKKSDQVLQDMSSTFNATGGLSNDGDMDISTGSTDGRSSGKSKGRMSGRGSKGGRGGGPSKRGKGRKNSGTGEIVYEYGQEPCESDTCRRPSDATVDWVQCDDCDKWYHTECVGLDLQELRDEDTFHCGCS